MSTDGNRLMFSGKSLHSIGTVAAKKLLQSSSIDIAEMSVNGCAIE